MGFFTDQELQIGMKLSRINREAVDDFIKLLVLLKEDKSIGQTMKSNPKHIRTLLGNFREMFGQDNDGYKYCVSMYNKDYCACGIKNCPDKSAHTLEVQSRRHYSAATTNVESDYEKDVESYYMNNWRGIHYD